MREILRKLEEGYGHQLFDDDVDLGDLLEFAEAYERLGNAVQEQLRDLVNWGEGRNPPQLNGNAVRMIQEKMGQMHPGIAEVCEAWLNAGEED